MRAGASIWPCHRPDSRPYPHRGISAGGVKIVKAGLALALVALALVAGCGSPEPKGAAASGHDRRAAGLDLAIRAWRAEIVRTDAACQDARPGKGCQGFEIACKAERAIAPSEKARGVTMKVVAGMRWSAWDQRRGEQMPVARFVLFTKTGEAWSRGERLNGNLATCQTYDATPA